jgi:hypothetical protein
VVAGSLSLYHLSAALSLSLSRARVASSRLFLSSDQSLEETNRDSVQTKKRKEKNLFAVRSREIHVGWRTKRYAGLEESTLCFGRSSSKIDCSLFHSLSLALSLSHTHWCLCISWSGCVYPSVLCFFCLTETKRPQSARIPNTESRVQRPNLLTHLYLIAQQNLLGPHDSHDFCITSITPLRARITPLRAQLYLKSAQNPKGKKNFYPHTQKRPPPPSASAAYLY